MYLASVVVLLIDGYTVRVDNIRLDNTISIMRARNLKGISFLDNILFKY